MSAAASRQAAISSSSTPSAARLLGVAGGDVGRHAQVLLGHQVRVDVVVDDRRVLVGAGDAVDVERARVVVVAERAPQPRRLDEQLAGPAPASNSSSRGRAQVADDGVGDVGVDVERRGARRPVGRALLAADRAPRERRALQPQLLRPLAREVERRVAPAQRVARPPPGACRSAAAARTSPCPRTRGRRSPGRSGPWPGSRGARRARPPAACERARSARPAGAPRRPRSRRRRVSQKLSRYSRWDCASASQPVRLALATAAATWSRTDGSERRLDQP